MWVYLSNNKSRDASVPDSGNQIHHVNEPSYQRKSFESPTSQPSDGPYEDSTKRIQRAVRRYPTQIPTTIGALQETRETKGEEYTPITTLPLTAASGINSSYIERLEDQLKRNKKKIEELQKKLENHNYNCVEKNKTLREEIRKLREENHVLKQKVQTLEEKIYEQRTEQKKQQSEHKEDKEEMKNSYQWLEDELNQEKEFSRSMETKCDSMKKKYDAQLKCLIGNEDLLCLRQLGVDVQVHIYKYVMREDFKEVYQKPDIGKIENFIDEQIDDPEKKTRAKERLQILKRKKYIKGALSHLQALKGLKNIGNNVAHPELDEEKIQTSISNLRKDNNLDDKTYAHVQKLTTMWKELIQM